MAQTRPIVTNRVLKNKVTGIDIFVPDLEEISGIASSTALYHVIVISRLFYYKTALHKESDVVQFMIRKKYEEFENFYKRLSDRFPSVIFPTLSRKTLLVSSSIIQERRKIMDEVLQLVARTQKLCCSPMLLEFVGVRKPAKRPHELIVSQDIFEENNTPQKEKTPDAPIEKSTSPKDESAHQTEPEHQIEPEKEIEQENLFVAVNLDESLPPEEDNEIEETQYLLRQDASETEDLDLMSRGHQSIFDNRGDDLGNEKVDDLFMPAHVEEKQSRPILQLDDDDDDLLNVGEDLDDLLLLSKKSESKTALKSTPPTKPKLPPRPRQTSKSSFDEGMSYSSDETKNVGDLFKGRKQSLREKDSKGGTLDGIFDKNKGTLALFSSTDDDDLFSTTTKPKESASINETMGENDILKYIEDNLGQEEVSLEL